MERGRERWIQRERRFISHIPEGAALTISRCQVRPVSNHLEEIAPFDLHLSLSRSLRSPSFLAFLSRHISDTATSIFSLVFFFHYFISLERTSLCSENTTRELLTLLLADCSNLGIQTQAIIPMSSFHESILHAHIFLSPSV